MSTDESLGQPERAESIETDHPSTQQHPSSDLLLDADSDQQPVLSVVMPTLNEQEGIGECILRVQRAVMELGLPTEVIISDSSTDRTPEIAREMGAIVVEPDKPGYGYAYRYGFEHVRGKYIVMGDADTTYDFEQIPRLLDPILEDRADIVMGSRLDGEIKPGAMPMLHKYIGNPLLTKFLNTFYDAGVSDAHSGFRVFTRDALDRMDLESDGMEFASEMVMDAGARGLRIEEVPIVYHEREGEETLDSFRDGWRHVRFMLLNAPGYLFSVPGIAFGLIGLLFTGLSIFDISIAGASFGVRTMIAGSLLMLVGFQVASFGLFSTVASDPIRQQSDPLTSMIINRVTLERGAAAGLTLIGIGVGYTALRLSRWLTHGYTSLSSFGPDVLGLTVVVLGIQFFFMTFFLSAIANSNN
ncbi:glycosyltransferase family 2 protein [Halorientalis marina]|uniref:glycosyltransferase family 2 protein n=1 Tax=Halorientalis marina TaxID=2931976 RepID=UPI001FF51689|nr:glycosyltransferase [Halorientalis marina]